MKVYKNKRGFAFSFFSFFLIMLLFTFAKLEFKDDDYSKVNDFTHKRILAIDSEIDYFNDVLLVESLGVSFKNTISALVNESQNIIFYQSYMNNYSRFNDLILEGMLNSSFDSNQISMLENKSVSYFLNDSIVFFQEEYSGDIDYRIDNVRVFEDRAFYLSMQVDYYMNISVIDSISSWEFNDSIVLSFPIYDLYEPRHFLTMNLLNNSPRIEPVEFYSSNLDWDSSLLNDTIARELASIYVDSNFKYAIGNSYLRNLFNNDVGSYFNVLGFWSFDYDEIEGGVYDTSSYNTLGSYFGNSLSLISFDEGFNDLSYYNNLVTNFQAIRNNNSCVYLNCSNFDGINDYVSVDLNTNLDEYTISFWLNPNLNSTTFGNEQGVMVFKNAGDGDQTSNSGLKFFLNSNGNLEFGIDPSNTSNLEVPYSLNELNFYALTSNSTHVEFFRNGQIISSGEMNMNYLGVVEMYLSFNMENPTGRYYSGIIDEVGVYSKVLSNSQIIELYEGRDVLNHDYVDSFYDKGIEFDGVDDYAQVNLSFPNMNDMDELSIESWVNFNSGGLNKNQVIFSGETNNLGVDRDYFLSIDNLSEIIFNISFNAGGGSNQNFLNQIPYNFEQDKNYYIVVNLMRDTSPPGRTLVIIYVNGELVFSDTVPGPPGQTKRITFNSDFILGSSSSNSDYFSGIIDEFRILNYSQSQEQILNNYYNFKAEVKGCCNYFIPINPNKYGFTGAPYQGSLVSYSTNYFVDYWTNLQQSYNITLYNITDLTSSNGASNYTNFLVDACLARAYNVQSFGVGNFSFVNTGDDDVSCFELIRDGIY